MAVTTDVYTDMRVRKVADFFTAKLADVIVVGRKMPDTFILGLPFRILLMRLVFKRSALFYAEFTFRFFFLGLFKRFDVIVANDLDTLLPCYFLSKLKRAELVYDSHEYFTESVGLKDSLFKRKIWLAIERMILPKVKHAYTVSEPIAQAYEQKYGTKFLLVRNFPEAEKIEQIKPCAIDFSGKKIILYQGVLNPGRNLENVVLAMQYIEEAVFLIIGYGELEPALKQLVKDHHLHDKVRFLGKMDYQEMMSYTKVADIGIALEYNYSESFKYSLPNKIFDYCHAELPFVSGGTPEVTKLIEAHNIGKIIQFSSPIELAEKLKAILENSLKLNEIKQAQKKAKHVFAWQNELKTLEKIYDDLI